MATVVRDAARETEETEGFAYTATSPVRPDQLTAEIAEAAASDAVGLSIEGVLTEASVDNPVEFWVNGATDPAEVLRIAQDHTPDNAWKPEAQSGPSLADVRALLNNGGTLDLAQASVALGELFRRVDALDAAVSKLQSSESPPPPTE